MPRYIDADALKWRYIPLTIQPEEFVTKSDIERAQTVDVVEVVRCEKCFYAIPYNERWTLPKKNNCMWCKRYEDERTPDWFCADGFALGVKYGEEKI